MTARLRIDGADRVKRKLKHIPGEVELNLRDTLFKAATDIKDEAIREIEAPKHGRMYTRRSRHKGVIVWRASAPGEAPAKKTGERMKGIKVRKSNRKLKPQSRVVAPAIYRLLAKGLDRIAPRPLFGPLLKTRVPGVLQRIKAAISGGVRKAWR